MQSVITVKHVKKLPNNHSQYDLELVLEFFNMQAATYNIIHINPLEPHP